MTPGEAASARSELHFDGPRGPWVAVPDPMELTRHPAMPALKVKLDLLEQTAMIALAVDWSGKFIQQGIYSGSAGPVAGKSSKVGIHHPLGLDDDAGLVGDGKADEALNRFV